jgi:hypothetical protein
MIGSFRWAKLILALAACLLLGLLEFNSALAAQATTRVMVLTAGSGISSPSMALTAGWFMQPHQPGDFTHRPEGWPHAALVLILVILVQVVILGLTRIGRRR